MPYLVSFYKNAAKLIDLHCNEASQEDFADRFVGNRIPPRAATWSMLCAWSPVRPLIPQPGDGRAIQLGEITSHTGELCDLQLKGAGITPYSRQGDRRAALRSSIREYLCSEAMHALDIPLRNQFVDRSAFDTWATFYRARLHQQPGDDSERKARMDRVNPKYILRNDLAQHAIERAEQDREFSEIDNLLKLFSRPFDEQPEMNAYAATPPTWAQQIEVSCSS